MRSCLRLPSPYLAAYVPRHSTLRLTWRVYHPSGPGCPPYPQTGSGSASVRLSKSPPQGVCKIKGTQVFVTSSTCTIGADIEASQRDLTPLGIDASDPRSRVPQAHRKHNDVRITSRTSTSNKDPSGYFGVQHGLRTFKAPPYPWFPRGACTVVPRRHTTPYARPKRHMLDFKPEKIHSSTRNDSLAFHTSR